MTTQELKERHSDGVAWEATCQKCGEPCRTHSTTGEFPHDVEDDGGFWHDGCQDPQAGEWRQV